MTSFTIDLPEALTTHYISLSSDNGEKVAEMIVADLAEYRKIMKRREAKRESRIFRENEFERL